MTVGDIDLIQLQPLQVHVELFYLSTRVLTPTHPKLDEGTEISKNFGDSCGIKGISQIGPGSSRGGSNLIADSGIQAQSHLPLGHVIRHVPLIAGIHIFWPGEGSIDNSPQAL